MTQLATVSVHDVAFEAYLAKSRLADAGITSYICDENIVSMNWFYTCAVGGIKVQVDDENSSEARTVLTGTPDGSWEDDSSYACPACGSEDTKITRYKKRLVFAFALLTGIVFPFLWRAMSCQVCGHTWQPAKKKSDSPSIVLLALSILCVGLGGALALLSFLGEVAVLSFLGEVRQ